MLELDILLQGFLNHGYEQLDDRGRQGFLELLGLEDTALIEYLMGRLVHKERHIRHVIEAIRACACH